MFYVYVLRSIKNNHLYVGSSKNIDLRLAEHNRGNNKSTKAYRPWIVVRVEEFKSNSLALKRERFLKTGIGRRILLNLLKIDI